MKSRLKKIANHVEPFINEVVEYGFQSDSLQEERSEAFLLAKKLFGFTPYISANSLIYEFTARIVEGFYSELGDIQDADNKLDSWLAALNDFLNEAGIVDGNFYNEKTAGPNNLYTDKYTNDLYTNDYLDMNKDVNKNKIKPSPTEKEDFISNSYALAKDLVNALPIVPRYDLMSQIAQDIERGDFDDISPVSEAKNNWEAWVARARKILQARNIILSNRNRLKK